MLLVLDEFASVLSSFAPLNKGYDLHNVMLIAKRIAGYCRKLAVD
jgi:hypothetical protein